MINDRPDSNCPVSVSKLRLEGVQLCRGAAALLVVLFHVSQLSREKLGQPFLFDFFRFGDVGVNFFFVLSGFIIFWVHHGDIGRRDRLTAFVLKRLIRIYPIYWLVTLSVVIVYNLLPNFGSAESPDQAAIVQSLLLIPQDHLPVLTVGWSLSHELLFYLVFSLVIFLKPAQSKVVISTWLSAIGLISILTTTQKIDLEANLVLKFIGSPHHLEFFLGCITAYILSRYKIRQSSFFVILGTVLLVIAGVDEPAQSTLGRVLASGIPSALILLGVASFDLKSTVQLPSIASYLGDASYSIYLVHYPYLSAALKIALLFNLFGRFGYAITMELLITTAILVGCLTHSWLEKPLVDFLRQTLIVSPSIRSVFQGESAMTILFLDQSGSLGGAELWLLDIVKPYRDRALVCLFTDGAFRTRLEQHQIPVHVLASQPLQVQKNSGWLQGLKSLGQLLPLVVQVARLSRKYDLIYANTPKALVVGALASLWTHRPLVYHLHDILSSDHFSPINRWLAVTLANRFAKVVIATSHAAQAAFIQAGGRSEITTVVYNGFDPGVYQGGGDRAAQLRQQLGLEGQFIVGHFSRLSPWKGQHVLLEALAGCSQRVTAVFVGEALYGEQDYVCQLRAQVEQLGLQERVRFLGFRDDVVPLMQACDLIAHTSTAPEPFGRVVVEAMLCGRPVVASQAGGIVELVESGVNGWLVPPGEPTSLASAIAHCRDHPHQTKTLAKTAQTQALQRFRLTTIQHQLDHLLRTASPLRG